MILRRFSVALASPLETSRGELTSRHGVLIGIERDVADGDADAKPVRGVGEATPLPGWTEPVETCRETLRRHAGEPPGAVLASLSETPATRHGLSLAILDAGARADGHSLATHLAGRDADVAETVPVNATIGNATPAETAARAERAVDAGYECLKLKAGVGSIELDLQRVRAVRDAVGEEILLRLDANGAWTESTARDAIERLATERIDYVEQPVPSEQLAALADLRGRGVDIAADEALGEYDIGDVLDADAADVVVLKPMALGGPDRAHEVALRARRAGVDAVVTTTTDAVVARTAAVHVAASIPDVRPCGLATGELLTEELAPDTAPVVDAAVEVPSGPGTAGETFDGLFDWDAA
jgi:o-succinylbenzoate synthase